MIFLGVRHMHLFGTSGLHGRYALAAKSDRLASEMLVLQEKCCNIR